MKSILIARVSTEEQKEAGNSLPAQTARIVIVKVLKYLKNLVLMKVLIKQKEMILMTF